MNIIINIQTRALCQVKHHYIRARAEVGMQALCAHPVTAPNTHLEPEIKGEAAYVHTEGKGKSYLMWS